ncbi:hypothetical protein PGTUg99_015745 [Puccinia graminis f. sp. tritici]|uniref:Uncharacterized protein n=1 Tax=Puccinia graminis f. sp. tritici TaxID=56615 RepID=A0A5B0RH65_PUCGR|nr:hypothetical protein PGTUg99_015745 [Puccinia graminis f. sp. tritici]
MNMHHLNGQTETDSADYQYQQHQHPAPPTPASSWPPNQTYPIAEQVNYPSASYPIPPTTHYAQAYQQQYFGQLPAHQPPIIGLLPLTHQQLPMLIPANHAPAAPVAPVASLPCTAPDDVEAPPSDSDAQATGSGAAGRTPEEIARAEDAAAAAQAEKLKKASNKAMALREKAASKRERDMVKQAELAAKESSNKQKWTDNSSLELLAMIKRVKEEYLDLKVKTGGFMKFTQFFGTRKHYKKHYGLLVDVTAKAMWSRYQVIMVAYRVTIHIILLVGFGSGGIHDALAQFHLALSLWEFLVDMHFGNWAANGTGQGELAEMSDEFGTKAEDVPGSDSEADGLSGSKLPATLNVSEIPAAPGIKSNTRSSKCACLSAGLTAAKRDLDSSSEDESELPRKMATPKATSAKKPVGSTPSGNGRPPAEGTLPIPRRCGRVEEAPKKEDSNGNAMVLLMHK